MALTSLASSHGRHAATLRRLADLGGPRGKLLGGERCQAHAVVRVHITVPLFHPRLQLGQPGDERHQSLVLPAFVFPVPDDRARARACSA